MEDGQWNTDSRTPTVEHRQWQLSDRPVFCRSGTCLPEPTRGHRNSSHSHIHRPPHQRANGQQSPTTRTHDTATLTDRPPTGAHPTITNHPSSRHSHTGVVPHQPVQYQPAQHQAAQHQPVQGTRRPSKAKPAYTTRAAALATKTPRRSTLGNPANTSATPNGMGMTDQR